MPEVASVAPSSPAPAPVPAAKPPEPKVEAKPKEEGEAPAPKPTHKFKVDGKDVEVPLEELEKHHGTFATSQARLKEAAQLKKEAAEEKASLVKALKARDVGKLKDAGLTEDEIDALAVEHLSKKQQMLLEEERIKELSPDLQELERHRKEKKERDAKDAETAKAQDQVKVKDEEARIARNVIASLESIPEKFRRSDFIAQRVFDAYEYFEQNKEKLAKDGFDVKQVTPKFIADKVLAEVRALQKQMLEAATDEELDDFPDSVAGRVLQRRQDKARKEAHPGLTVEPQFRGKKETEEPKPALTHAQLIRRSYFGGGK